MTEAPTAAIPSMPKQLDVFESLRSRISPETTIRRQEPLSRRTTLRVGGPADIYLEPASIENLSAIVRFCHDKDVPYFVLGRGSNLLIKDAGFRGVVISLATPHFSRIEIGGEHLCCGAGAKLKAVAFEARRHGLSGLEFLEGIPGTVGGGLRMNAGAMNGEIFNAVESVRVMDSTGCVQERTPSDLQVSYRSCSALKYNIALGAVLRGSPAPMEQIEQRMKEFSQKRWSSQPAAPSAGCIFKNPITIPAGKLIDELGLKGTRVGGAYVSSEHGNFIINDGTGTARDVLDLIDLIRQCARKQRGIELETEVEILGD